LAGLLRSRKAGASLVPVRGTARAAGPPDTAPKPGADEPGPAIPAAGAAPASQAGNPTRDDDCQWSPARLIHDRQPGSNLMDDKFTRKSQEALSDAVK